MLFVRCVCSTTYSAVNCFRARCSLFVFFSYSFRNNSFPLARWRVLTALSLGFHPLIYAFGSFFSHLFIHGFLYSVKVKVIVRIHVVGRRQSERHDGWRRLREERFLCIRH